MAGEQEVRVVLLVVFEGAEGPAEPQKGLGGELPLSREREKAARTQPEPAQPGERFRVRLLQPDPPKRESEPRGGERRGWRCQGRAPCGSRPGMSARMNPRVASMPVARRKWSGSSLSSVSAAV